MLATRAMQTMALMSYMLAFLLAITFNCLEQTASYHRYTGYARALEVLGTIGTAFCIIGVSVYGAKADKIGTLDYSYALTVLSLFFSIPGLVMVAVTRNAVQTSMSSVSPLPEGGNSTSGPSVVISAAQQGPQPAGFLVTEGGQPTTNGRFSYGYGQHHRPAGPDGSGSSANNGNSAPSFVNNDMGNSRGLPRGNASSNQNLPYPMYPDGPANAGRMSPASDPLPMPMPEPGPVGGGGGRNAGGTGYGQQAGGEGRAPARLPPLGPGVAPTAPPPPGEEEAPPSYMEAIGYGHR
ncbi:hypothetical protein BaRGS_00001160 [Batillaria attramentaria]|uniref:Uncharacterized protein n=1 Tax=Batillaria attramentaria TaxID=370345 RepID=A0ABD0M6V5_9CAEN